MFKKRCPSCEEKVKKSFNFCPHCGVNFKQRNTEDLGMLGSDDNFAKEELRLPQGIEGMLGGMIKQLEKQISGNMSNNNGAPRGFKIQISTGNPNAQPIIRNPVRIEAGETIVEKVSGKELERRNKLPKINAESNVRRLPEGLIYEIQTPGVKGKGDVTITRMEGSIEVKAYSKDKCYLKSIPLKLQVISYSVLQDKVILRLKE